MGIRCNINTKSCIRYIPDYDIGFKIVTPRRGDCNDDHKYSKHIMIFLLEGEVEFSYNELLNRRFKAGDMFFIPQASEIYVKALADVKALVLTFDNRVESFCEKCRLSEFANGVAEVDYDFRPLIITDTLYLFARLMEQYLAKDIKCSYLHELKQKELFLLLGTEYSERELAELFYPVLNCGTDFRTRILENYHYGLNISELSHKFGMSYSPFLRQFKKEFGMPAQQWMLKQKAKHIKLRLSIPSTRISDIVTDFEFTDLPHFIRFCRKQYGCTPSELKESLNNLQQ